MWGNQINNNFPSIPISFGSFCLGRRPMHAKHQKRCKEIAVKVRTCCQSNSVLCGWQWPTSTNLYSLRKLPTKKNWLSMEPATHCCQESSSCESGTERERYFLHRMSWVDNATSHISHCCDCHSYHSFCHLPAWKINRSLFESLNSLDCDCERKNCSRQLAYHLQVCAQCTQSEANIYGKVTNLIYSLKKKWRIEIEMGDQEEGRGERESEKMRFCLWWKFAGSMELTAKSI